MDKNQVLDVINNEIARIDRAIEILSVSRGKDLTYEENRLRTKNLLTMSKQNLQSLTLSLSKEARFIDKMVNNTSCSQNFDMAVSGIITEQVNDETCGAKLDEIWDK